MKAERLVDRFVDVVNAGHRVRMAADEVPTFLRDGEPDEASVGWKIVKADNSARIEALTSQLPKRFPPSFHYFVSHYSFPAFETRGFMLFANTGQENFWELRKRIFADAHMSATLLKAGFIQIGNPFFYNYDPVCFNTKEGKLEHPIVQLDHESALQFGETKVVKEIASSFVDFLSSVVTNGDA